MNFSGIFVPIITSFDTSGKVYKKGIHEILSYLHEQGINGVWLLGSYGSFPLMSIEERMQVVTITLPKVQELGMTVIVNVGSCATDTAVRLARIAEDSGAHAVASVVPFYYSSTHYRDRNFLAYFKALVAATKIPVFYYNNANATGYTPSIKLLRKLFHAGVFGLKDKGDYASMAARIRTLKEIRPNGAYLSGTTSIHLQGHLLGACGVTSGTALATPLLVRKLQSALDRKDIDEAIRLQEIILHVREAMGRFVGRAVSCYDILKAKGVDAGTCRSPWLRMRPEEAREVVSEVQELEKKIDKGDCL